MMGEEAGALEEVTFNLRIEETDREKSGGGVGGKGTAGAAWSLLLLQTEMQLARTQQTRRKQGQTIRAL